MARETWTVDGYALTDGAVRDVELREGLYATPEGYRGELTAVGARHGLLWRPRPLGPGAFALQLWLGADSRAELEDAYDELLRYVIRPERLLSWRRGLADGSVREAMGQVVERIEPAPIGQLGMRVGLVVQVPDGRWRDLATSDSGALAPGVAVELAAFADATAPMDDLVVTVNGPLTGNLRVEDVRSGKGFSYSGALPGVGQSLTVNAGSWTLTGATWATLSYDGATPFELTPGTPSGPPAIKVTGDGMTGATRVRVTGRQAYLA